MLTRHVAAINAGVEGEGFEALGAGLTEGCSMVFDGIAVGPFHGRDAIVEAYRTNPPDDRIIVLEATYPADRVEATYAWGVAPQRPAGRILLDLEGDLISSITIDYWPDDPLA